MRDRKIVENNGVPEYATYADMPDPADYKGLALVQDGYTLYKSDGLYWTPFITGKVPQNTRLEGVDQVPIIFYAASKDGQYVFGRNADGKSISRTTLAYAETIVQDCTLLYSEDGVTTLGASSYPSGIFTTDNGYVFAQVIRFSDTKAFLYKSVDNGANWGNNYPAFDNKAPISRIGYNGSTHIANVSILGERGFAEIKEGGRTYYAYGEYNVAGSGNQDVAVVVSHDLGTTWTRSIFLSSSRHIHFVKQDPYYGYIWVGFGDTAAQNGLMRLDSILRTIPVGMTHAQIANKEGCKILYGLKRYATTDLHFEPNHILNPVDLGGGISAALSDVEAGIWKMDYELTYYERVYNPWSPDWDGHSLYWIQKHTSTNTLIACEIVETTTDQNVYTTRFITSVDGGLTWKCVATARCRVPRTSQGPASFLEWDDKIWIAGNTFASNMVGATMAIRPTVEVFDETKHGARTEIGADGTLYEYGIESIIPFTFVDNTLGTNGAGYGYSPRTPFKTLTYALGSNRSPNGAVIRIIGTLAETTGVSANFLSPLYPSEPNPIYPTVIKGCGKNGPEVVVGITFAYLEMRDTPRTGRVDIRDINFRNTAAGAFINNATDAAASTVRVIDSKISVTNANAFQASKGKIDIARCEVSSGTSAPLSVLSGIGTISANDSLLATTGSVVCSQNSSGGKLTLTKCSLTGFTTYAINLSSITPASITSLTDCLLYSAGGTAAILGNSGVTYTSSNFNNVVSNKAFTNVNGTPNVIQDAALTITDYRTNKTILALSGSSLDVEKKPSISAGCYSIT